jgi:hypothetical protein
VLDNNKNEPETEEFWLREELTWVEGPVEVSWVV